MAIAKQFPGPLLFLFLLLMISCSRKMIPDQPALARTLILDTLPSSEIDIPVRINLRPLYKLAEQQVQQIYTSPGYPRDYVVEDCETRYMYRFRRGPLQFSASGDRLSMAFTGRYQLAGGQRICSGTGSDRTAISPWSPTCSCGLWEPERRVQVALSASFRISSDYRLQATLDRGDPVPMDRCRICVFNYDITATVMEKIKQQIDDARKSMVDSLAAIDYRPRFQQLWDALNKIHPLSGYGYLAINPQAIRLSEVRSSGDTMTFTIGITAKPVVSQSAPKEIRTMIPDLGIANDTKGFSIYTDTHLDYDSLSRIVNSKMAGQRIDLEKYGKHIIIDGIQLYGGNNEKLVGKVLFHGSVSGEFYITGRPVYDSVRKQLKLEELNYDIRSKDMMLKSAEFLFSGRILRELRTYSTFDLGPHIDSLLHQVNPYLKQELRKGIVLNGNLDRVNIERIYPFADKLLIRFTSSGNMEVRVNDLSL